MAASGGPLWPVDEAGLRQRFEQAEFSREEIPTGDQASLLLALLKVYADSGLAPATRPLCVCCRHKTSCWRSDPCARRSPTRDAPEEGGIILPWVGAGYRPGGVLIIAINPNIDHADTTYLLTEHEIAWDRHQRTLESNRTTDEGSRFAYRTARSAALLLDSADKHAITDRHRPKDLVDALHRTARLQAVKCVPRRDRSRPTQMMERTCPEFLLEQELAILRPGLILTLGNVPDAAVARLPGYEYLKHASSEYLWRHLLWATWGRADVFSIPHPADPRGGWQRGHEELLGSLRPQ